MFRDIGTGLIIGFAQIPHAIRLILRTKKTILLALLPMAAALVLGLLGIGGAVWLAGAVASLSVPLASLLAPVMAFGTFSMTAIIVAVVVPPLVMLIGIPLCEPLALEVDAHLIGQERAAVGLGGMIRAAIVGAVLAVLSIAGDYALSQFLDVEYIRWLYAAILYLVWKPLILSFDACDAVMAARDLGLFQRLGLLLRDPFATLGVGLATFVLVTIPVLNLFGLPIAVVLGTLHANRLEPT